MRKEGVDNSLRLILRHRPSGHPAATEENDSPNSRVDGYLTFGANEHDEENGKTCSFSLGYITNLHGLLVRVFWCILSVSLP